MPLPLHEIATRNGEAVGRPSIGFGYIDIGYGRDLVALTVTETPWKRLELGFGYDLFEPGRPAHRRSKREGGPPLMTTWRSITPTRGWKSCRRGSSIRNGCRRSPPGFITSTMTAFDQINNQLGGTLSKIGLSDNEGLDFTLYGSKLLTFLPRPVLVNLGGRATKSAEIGLLGFTDEYSFVFEGSVVVLLTDKFMVAGEYKQQPSSFTPVPGLIGTPGDWWTIDAGYVINPHMTVAVGYGHFGTVANHTANTRLGHHYEVGVLRITGTQQPNELTMKAIKNIGLENVQAVYGGPEGDLWELVMGEQIHIGGFQSSMDLAKRAGIGAGMQGVDLCCCNGAGMRFLVKFCGVASMRGVDATAKVVERGRQRCQALGLDKQISFTLADVCATGLPVRPAPTLSGARTPGATWWTSRS